MSQKDKNFRTMQNFFSSDTYEEFHQRQRDDMTRKLTDKEMKILMGQIQDSMQEWIKANQAFINGNWGNSPVTTPQNSPIPLPPSPNFGASSGRWSKNPTSENSGEYQEPERDEQGTYYGYKVLHRNGHDGCHCSYCMTLVSPNFHALWTNGELEASSEPREHSIEHSMVGIHCTKRPDHPELRDYYFRDMGNSKGILVKCALSGTIVETTQGFRAQHAQIIELYIGEWITYDNYMKYLRGEQDEYRRNGQNYKECSSANPDRVAQKRKIRGQNYNWLTYDDLP